RDGVEHRFIHVRKPLDDPAVRQRTARGDDALDHRGPFDFRLQRLARPNRIPPANFLRTLHPRTERNDAAAAATAGLAPKLAPELATDDTANLTADDPARDAAGHTARHAARLALILRRLDGPRLRRFGRVVERVGLLDDRFFGRDFLLSRSAAGRGRR